MKFETKTFLRQIFNKKKSHIIQSHCSFTITLFFSHFLKMMPRKTDTTDTNKRLSQISTSTWPDEDKPTLPPPMYGNFYNGWSTSLEIQDTPSPVIISPSPAPNDEEEMEKFDDADDTSFSGRTSGSCSDRRSSVSPPPQRRKSSVQIGNEVMAELLEKDNVRHAIEILQQAVKHLDMTHQEEGEQKEDISKIYSQIIKSLCDPNISKIVEEMTPGKECRKDFSKCILWRLFTKVVESGHVLQVNYICICSLLYTGS
jgi:hypothetical protein